MPDEQDDIDSRRKSLISEIEQIKRRKKKWQEAYVGEAISLSDLRDRTREDEEREESLEQELARLPVKQPAALSKVLVAEMLSRATEVFKRADERSKKGFLKDLFKMISVDAERGNWKPARGRYATPVNVSFTLR